MGRMMNDRSGQTFGRLLVLRCERRDGETWAVCRCACGAEKDIRIGALVAGNIKACGCLRSETMRARQTKHGEGSNGRETAEYRAWRGMINRCKGGDEGHRRVYVARGITVCARWARSFKAFLSDVGRRPSPNHSIDRYPDNDGHYEPGNVRWATRSQQAINRRPRPRTTTGTFAGGAS